MAGKTKEQLDRLTDRVIKDNKGQTIEDNNRVVAPKTPIQEIRYVKADEVYAEIKKLVEQFQPVDLSSVQDDVSAIKLVLAEILELLKRSSKTDDMERDLMDMLKKKIEKG